MITNQESRFYSGTSGLALPIPKRLFPPEYQDKSRLQYYSMLFNSIEINSSFYKLPLASTVRKWAEAVPDHFRFTFKLWKAITHNKGLDFEPANIESFFQVINQAGDNKGCLLVQFPPSLTITCAAQLKDLLICLRKSDPDHTWNIALEFRNRSWYQEAVYDLLQFYDAGMVLHDIPASAISMMDSPVGFVYLRFHGPAGAYRGSYADDFLQEYAQYVADWIEEEKEVYVYFNNTMGEAVGNLQTLNRFVGM
ncbi:MAG: DUF72 domain-containing protein [Chitinophagaceae bacterium]